MTAPKPLRNLVSSGGASHVATLAGALYEASRRVELAGVGGTSAGALAAIALAFNVSADTLYATLVRLLRDNKVLDRSPAALIDGYGLCHWNVVRDAIRDMIGPHARMGDAAIPLFIVVTDTYTRRPVVISSWANPNVLVHEAGTASAACWPLAKLQTIPSLGRGNRRYADGGFVSNFPVHVFDDAAAPTIGFRIDVDAEGDLEPDITPVRSVTDAAMAIAESVLYHSNRPQTRRADFVDVRVNVNQLGGGFDFNLDEARVRARWIAGQKAASKALAIPLPT